ncbi:hypothetical protein B0A52_04917 [Exophiala mesophila]|uniref:Major facilitator superfamily (MFS) profile domain-containing protein n=1 Tax=Exophiala mesophila TaxID=212818 RepID=A0A438N6E0_EXOME|nr:hypothetical protein B0A52_04917 [Exophiala mesophila]
MSVHVNHISGTVEPGPFEGLPATLDPGLDGDKEAKGPLASTTPAWPTARSQELEHTTIAPGVARMEAIHAELRLHDRIILFASIFIVAYAYGLDYLTRNTYQAYATSSYSQHSLLSTINVIRGVVAASIQPLIAKLADIFGRVELFVMAVIFYVMGTIIQTFALNVQTFAAGALFYQIGYNCSLLVIEIIIADTTSMKTRMFFAYLPGAPYIINTWISGNVVESVLRTSTWKWGIGMWAIIYPICSIPLIVVLVLADRRSRKSGFRPPPTFTGKNTKDSVMQLFWKLDLVGNLLLSGALAMILIPMTLAGGQSRDWQSARIITPIVIGFLFVPAFVCWERVAPYPMVPMHLLKDRGVWSALGIVTWVTFSFMITASFLYTVLVVGFDFSVAAATRISSLYSFCAVTTGLILGLIISKVRRLKPFILAGVLLWLVGYGLLVQYRGGIGSPSRSGVIGGQVILGIAGGFFPYPALVEIQAMAKHEHVAVLTSLLLTMSNMGFALGNAVSGALWTQTLYKRLQADLAGFDDGTLAAAVYASPFAVLPEYPVGTPVRTAIISSYRYIQRLLSITGICMAIPIAIFALTIRNPRLSDNITQQDAEKKALEKNDGSGASSLPQGVFSRWGHRLMSG